VNNLAFIAAQARFFEVPHMLFELPRRLLTPMPRTTVQMIYRMGDTVNIDRLCRLKGTIRSQGLHHPGRIGSIINIAAFVILPNRSGLDLVAMA
jgi:hypothetical protein